MVHPKPSLAHQPRFLLPRRVSRESWRGEIHCSAVREFPRAPSHWDNGTTISPRKLATAMFSITLFVGTKKRKKEWLRIVRSSRSVRFETGRGAHRAWKTRMFKSFKENIYSLSQVFRRNLRLIVLF